MFSIARACWARRGGQELDSANSQFFLMRAAFPKLERQYTAFGRVIAGPDVVTAIKTGEPVADPQDKMERVACSSISRRRTGRRSA
jgi:cyclophilin family peptidyl-prolyl cis-trans isomerase